jgi:hypothetical protein
MDPEAVAAMRREGRTDEGHTPSEVAVLVVRGVTLSMLPTVADTKRVADVVRTVADMPLRTGAAVGVADMPLRTGAAVGVADTASNIGMDAAASRAIVP